jgi:hypothetical protein
MEAVYFSETLVSTCKSTQSHYKGKKVKLALEQAMKTQKRSRGIARVTQSI